MVRPLKQIITFQSAYENELPVLKNGVSNYFKAIRDDFAPKGKRTASDIV